MSKDNLPDSPDEQMELLRKLKRRQGQSGWQPTQRVDPKGRLTVVETVYYQADLTQEADSFETRYTVECESMEQVYERRKMIGSQWTPIEWGWVEDAELLLIINDGPAPVSVLIDSHVILCDLPKGQSLRIPRPKKNISYRLCACGDSSAKANVRAVLVPK